MKSLITLVATTLFVTSALISQGGPSPAFTYQGRLTVSGQPAAGLYDIAANLYNDATAGKKVGDGVTNLAVTVTGGLFTTTLDLGADVFDGSPLWLEVAVRPAGSLGGFTSLSPRQPVTAAPWSSFAVTAASAASVPAQTITAGMLANGSVTAAKLASGVLTHLDAADGSPASAVTVNTNGLVGVGTAAPVAGLQITASVTNAVAQLRSDLIHNVNGYTNLDGDVKVAAGGNRLVLCSYSSGGLSLVDISSPASPVLQWSIVDGSGSYTNLGGVIGAALSSSGNLLAAAAYSDDAVTLIDVTTPTAPIYRATLRDGTGSYTGLDGAAAVNLAGSLLAIAADRDDALTLVDVSNPASPVFKIAIADGQLGFDDLDGACALAQNGNLLAIAARNDNAVTLVNVANPLNPVRQHTLKYGSNGYTNLVSPTGLALSGNLLAIAAYGSDAVTLVDISTPTAPVLRAVIRDGQGGFDALAGARAVAFQGNLLWIAASTDAALTVVDVANPAAPQLRTVIRNGSRGTGGLRSVSSLAAASSTMVAGGHNAVTLWDLGATGQAGLVSDHWVGIGTAQPAAPLHVNGNVIVENASAISLQGTGMNVHNGKKATLGQASGWTPGGGDSGVFLEGGTAEGGGFYADGDIAAIWSAGDGDILRVYDEDDLPTGSPKFVISPSGYVGVLTNIPQTALHVVGTTLTTALTVQNSAVVRGDLVVQGSISNSTPVVRYAPITVGDMTPGSTASGNDSSTGPQFPPGQQSGGSITFTLPADYVSGTPFTLELYLAPLTAASGTTTDFFVRWTGYHNGSWSGTGGSILSTPVALGAAGYLVKQAFTLPAIGYPANAEIVNLTIRRYNTSPGDTYTGTIALTGLRLSYEASH